MKINLLAFDSMGVRSMATQIKTKDVVITIDPGLALGPKRYGLEPHPLEYKEEIERWMKVQQSIKESDVIIITHYHYDHYNPDKPELYEGKIVLIKDYNNKINSSQQRRATSFIPSIEKIAKSVEIADGKEFSFGQTKIKFSEPIFHGKTPKLGFVLQTLVDDGKEKVIHTSDIGGPNNHHQIDFILEHKPNTVIMDGPISYMIGYNYSNEDLANCLELLKDVLKLESLQTLIFDHHFMRDLRWNERIAPLYRFAKENNCKIMPASRFMGFEPTMLEARRKELWSKEI